MNLPAGAAFPRSLLCRFDIADYACFPPGIECAMRWGEATYRLLGADMAAIAVDAGRLSFSVSHFRCLAAKLRPVTGSHAGACRRRYLRELPPAMSCLSRRVRAWS